MYCSNLFPALRTAYSVEVARTPDQITEAQRLRYQVFVQERGIFTAQGPEPIETDEFDPWSHHLLIRRRADRAVVATSRLVTSTPERGPGLPIQRVCEVGRLGAIPLARAGEISRFAISKSRRGGADPRLEQMLLLTLVDGVLHLSLDLGLTHWCALMERSLIRLLQRIGICFEPVGPIIAHYGLRQPAVARIESILADGERRCPAHYDFVRRAAEAPLYA